MNSGVKFGEDAMCGCDREPARGRRNLLKLLAAAAGVGAVGALFGAGPARAKSSQAAAAYRGSPNGRQRCANCSWFEPPSGCGVVRGPVSARGWCNLWG
ncbi:twin-arginine translocation signal domain-containing protein [Methylocystis sp. WRRC1]|uniref:twin-arginine translocation signal domain-containing protein n=1 Tax=Methylocystis sp. WRRC1 TaxID=1732014 RepID=UPI001D155E18|nr:twin-arginine translocation signal domain-containing protein [Methylocystis sp. WRRC1]MCC3245690.1 twin-arginine translocation signal domain-containing protein [Methylocystis sp. WRRC1]